MTQKCHYIQSSGIVKGWKRSINNMRLRDCFVQVLSRAVNAEENFCITIGTFPPLENSRNKNGMKN